MGKTNVIDACKGCLNIRIDNKCEIINEPCYMWKDGHKCWAYVDDPEVIISRLREIFNYSSIKGAAGATLGGVISEIRAWEAGRVETKKV
jgi:hypothetical protein